MVNRNVLIGKVSPYLGKREIIVGNQDTTDIIDALIKNHYKYASEYDKIYRYFEGGSVEETMYNVWQFLKDDFNYTIEPEKMQILRSPAAILASNIVGIDCKGYSTFINGLADAFRRNTGKKFDVYYRFASYDPFDKTPQHVFAVINENGNEIWVDPVLDQFDEKKQPYYYKDKKIKNMALVAMSGIKKMGDIVQDYNGNYIDDQTGEYVGTPSYSSTPDTTDTSSSSNLDWFSAILKNAPSIITASKGGVVTTPKTIYNAGGGNVYIPNTGVVPATATGGNVTSSSTGISTNTIFLIGAVGLAAYFIIKKK
jgi:hypothetical protein